MKNITYWYVIQNILLNLITLSTFSVVPKSRLETMVNIPLKISDDVIFVQ